MKSFITISGNYRIARYYIFLSLEWRINLVGKLYGKFHIETTYITWIILIDKKRSLQKNRWRDSAIFTGTIKELKRNSGEIERRN